jgi:hypothetical protein
MWDTEVTVKVFAKLLEKLGCKWIVDPIEILDFQNRKICDCI